MGTITKCSGVSIAVIFERPDHTTEKTMQTYLDGFENEVLDEANRKIFL